MKLTDLQVEHDYYCSPSNYYSNEAQETYKCFPDFIKDYGINEDVNMNLIFRFDLKETTQGENVLKLFMIKQRTGIFSPIEIRNITEADTGEIQMYLSYHFDYLKELWKPF